MAATGSGVLHVLGTAIGVPNTLARSLAPLSVASGQAKAMVTTEEVPAGLADVTRLAIEHSPLLCIHAGVVAGRDGFIVIPGRSGLGMTTLTAFLTLAGFEYVSDEALAVDRATSAVTPFPRPLSLAADVWDMLPSTLGPPPVSGAEALVSPAVLGAVRHEPGRVTDIVLARRRPGGVHLARSNRSEAVVALLTRSFNHYHDPEGSFRTIVGLVRAARVWTAAYADASSLAELMAERLGPITSTDASRTDRRDLG